MSGDLFLGVDGGKSKTICLLATGDGTIVGVGRAGNADHSTVPLAVALDTVASAVSEATRQVGVSPDAVAVGCFGLAGAVWPEDFRELADGLRRRGLTRDVTVRNDAQVALRAASPSGEGIVVSAGTHLSVALRTPRGDEWFSGWSSVDGPGGAEAGRRVAWAVIHAFDGRGPQTALADEVLLVTGSDAEGLLRMMAGGELSESFTASLAPVLFRVYERSHDPVARSIIDDLGSEMAGWIPALRPRFPADQGVDVYCTGGLFHSEEPRLDEAFRSRVIASTPDARIHRSVQEPAVGALMEAIDHAGVPNLEHVVARIAASGPPTAFFATD